MAVSTSTIAAMLLIWRKARSLGASLVVGVNSDASVKRQGKGDDRPINNEANRMAVLAALEAVSLVVVFDEHANQID